SIALCLKRERKRDSVALTSITTSPTIARLFRSSPLPAPDASGIHSAALSKHRREMGVRHQVSGKRMHSAAGGSVFLSMSDRAAPMGIPKKCVADGGRGMRTGSPLVGMDSVHVGICQTT